MDEEFSYIYALCDLDETIRYIGYSKYPEKRYKAHLKSGFSKKKTHKNDWIRSLEKIGEKPVLKILEKVEIEIVREREIYWISYYKGLGYDLVNATSGGDGVPNPDALTRSKMAEKAKGNQNMLGKHHSEESREKMSKNMAGKPSPMKGKMLSEEAKQKLRDANIGKKWSEESKKKLSDTTKGRPLPEYQKEILREKLKGNSNSQGAKRKGEKSSKYVGVSWSKKRKKWLAAISGIRLGGFLDEKDAARAYNKKAIELFGDKARLNIVEGD